MLYVNLSVEIKFGKTMEEIMQMVGVRQGDNMAPILFLFLVAAVAQILEQEWEKNDVRPIQFLR